MATLTETAYYTRKAINWGIIALVALVIFRILLGIAIGTWQKIFPPPPPPPTVAFGKLPALKFPQVASPSAKINYSLETIEGAPSATSSTGTVFFISKPEPNLLSLTRARQFAARMNFVGEPQAENQTVYRWQDNANPLRALRIDIVTGNFRINYDYPQDLGVFAEKNLPSQNQAFVEAINFMQNLQIFLPALAKGQPKITYWQLVGNNLVQTTSLANANAVRVDFARENILGMKLFTANPPWEPVYFLFSGSKETSKRILEASYKFWNIESEQMATYPLKTAASAWEELRQGGGFVAKITPGTQSVVVRKIYLAYFYPDDYQSFLQPIYVFEGDPNFLGFVSAVIPSWVGK